MYLKNSPPFSGTLLTNSLRFCTDASCFLSNFGCSLIRNTKLQIYRNISKSVTDSANFKSLQKLLTFGTSLCSLGSLMKGFPTEVDCVRPQTVSDITAKKQMLGWEKWPLGLHLWYSWDDQWQIKSKHIHILL